MAKQRRSRAPSALLISTLISTVALFSGAAFAQNAAADPAAAQEVSPGGTKSLCDSPAGFGGCQVDEKTAIEDETEDAAEDAARAPAAAMKALDQAEVGVDSTTTSSVPSGRALGAATSGAADSKTNVNAGPGDGGEGQPTEDGDLDPGNSIHNNAPATVAGKSAASSASSSSASAGGVASASGASGASGNGANADAGNGAGNGNGGGEGNGAGNGNAGGKGK